MDGAENRGDGLGLTLGAQHLGLPVGLGAENGRLAITLGAEDRGLPVAASGQDLGLALALGQKNRGPLVAFRAGTFLHGVAYGRRRFDGAQLDPVDLYSPFAGRLVQHRAQTVVDLLTGG